MKEEIITVYKPNLESLMKVSKHLLLNLPHLKFFPFIILLVAFTDPQIMGLQSDLKSEEDSYWMTILPLVSMIIIWILIYFLTLSVMKKNILSNKRNFETQTITFTEHAYIQEGETFKIENFWNEIYQIKETGLWFLIYPNKHSAFPIIKSDLKGNQYQELKNLFNSLNIKKKLK